MNPKARLRHKADKLYFERFLQKHCEICGKKAIQLHHFYPKGLYGHLRYDRDNGISLCMGHHFRIHHQDPTISVDIIERKGVGWYEILRQKAQNPPKDYRINIGWYKKQIEQLKQYE